MAQVAILDYARAGLDRVAAQPLDSLFTLTERDGRLTLTQRLPPAWSGALGRMIVGVFLCGFGASAVVVLQETPTVTLFKATLAAVLIGSAVAAFADARRVGRPRELRLTLDDRGLTVVNGPHVNVGRPWRIRRPGRFIAVHHVFRRRSASSTLYAYGALGLRRIVLERIGRDDALWLEHLLNGACARRRDGIANVSWERR